MDNTTLSTSDDRCEEHPPLYLGFKMALVGVFGTAVALIGFLENILLFYTFISSRTLRQKNLHLTCLSACDIFVCFSYIEIMSMQVYAEYFHYFPLYRLWHDYLRVAFTISHIAICSSSFLIMAAAVERYLQTRINKRSVAIFSFFCRHRAKIVIAAFLFGAIFRGVEISELGRNVYFDGIWRFWTRRIATVFLPFFVLAYCNAVIVASLRKSNEEHTIKMLVVCSMLGISAASYNQRDRVKAATRSLIMVVTCYLCSNIIDVFIAAWEYLDSASLMQLEEFYTIATDVSSLLTVLAASLRLPIYLINDKVILNEVRFTVCFYYNHFVIHYFVPTTQSRSMTKGDIQKMTTSTTETPKNAENNIAPLKLTYSFGAVLLSVAGTSIDEESARPSVTASKSNWSPDVLQPLPVTKERQVSEINNKHEIKRLLLNSSVFDEI